MKYQAFSNRQIRPLPKSSVHSTHVDLRDTSVETVPLESVGITGLALLLRKASEIHF